MTSEINIGPLNLEEIDDFFKYLNDHISDNGENESPLFLPISRQDLRLPEALALSFKEGQAISIDQPGWRRAWLARNNEGDIIGHIDLKSHGRPYTQHRAILGMGVHRDYRKIGLGSYLIESVIAWVKENTAIEHIDLWVLSQNSPATRLYQKSGFQKIGEVEGMFRIDGASLGHIMMTKKLTE